MDLIKDLWRGDVPLVKSYWLFGVVVGIFFRIIFAYIEYQAAIFYTALGAIFIFAFIIFVFAYSIFISFAIWKSANKYQGQQRYAILAKISVIIGVIMIIAEAIEIFGVV
jgi:hypothetical protein